MPAPKYFWLVGEKKKGGGVSQNVVYLHISTSASKGSWKNDPTSKRHLFYPACFFNGHVSLLKLNDSSLTVTPPFPVSHQNFETSLCARKCKTLFVICFSGTVWRAITMIAKKKKKKIAPSPQMFIVRGCGKKMKVRLFCRGGKCERSRAAMVVFQPSLSSTNANQAPCWSRCGGQQHPQHVCVLSYPVIKHQV